MDVVVITWNDEPELLDRAITSALAAGGTDVRIIVVDNGSEPPASVRPPAVLLRNPTNRGVAAARNQGARAGTAPYVLFLDSDAALLPGAVAALLAPMSTDDAIGLSAPVLLGQAPAASAGLAPRLGRKLARAANLVSTYAAPEPAGPWWEVDFAIGACQLVRRSAFDSVGGLDETYFYGPEDVDFCLRLKSAGWRVVQVAGARCEHPARRRFRRPFSPRTWQHGWAVLRHLWRHRTRGGRPPARGGRGARP